MGRRTGEQRSGQGAWPRRKGFCPTIALSLLLLVVGKVMGGAEADQIEQALAVVRDCLTRSPAPWPEAWQREYIDTIRQAIVPNRDAAQYGRRLEILARGFRPYWDGLKKDQDRSLFEIQRAQIRWYVESLMATDLPGEEEIQTLRHQYEEIGGYAASSLLTQFPFLDPQIVHAAKADYLGECYRSIQTPLLPIFLRPFSLGEIDTMKRRWYDLRYARVDLWRQLGSTGKTSRKDGEAAAVQKHPDYVLTQRSLGMLDAGIEAVGTPAPEYFQSSVASALNVQRQRFLAKVEARRRETRLSTAAVQTEYLSFLLATLLETAASTAFTDSGGTTQSSSENHVFKGGDSP